MAALLVALACTFSARAQDLGAGAAADEPPPRAVLLVNTDRRTREAFDQAAAFARDRQYAKAVELLQSLVLSEARAFYPAAGDVRRHISINRAATDALGALAPEALALYGRLYDAPAARLLEEAERARSEAHLGRVARDYFQTPAAARALDLLATWAFDRGAFLEAGHAWQRVGRDHRRPGLDRALVLAKAAVAYHLAGAEAEAAALRDLLRAAHAGAEGIVAGRRVNLAGFAAEALAARPVLAPAPREPVGEWTSPAGSAAAVAVMGDFDAPPVPLWTEREASRLQNVHALLGLGGRPETDGLGTWRVAVAIAGGRVVLTTAPPGQEEVTFDLPALVHPLVLGGAVVCRRDDAVIATDLATGKELWRTADLPMYRTGLVEGGSGGIAFSTLAGDTGRYTLSAGGGKIYTVCRFRRIDPATYRKFASGGLLDSSTLAAVSVEGGRPRVRWEVGNGQGPAQAGEVVRQAKVLAAPTVEAGRLYAIATHANTYWAICLDADSGAPLWETPIGPIPTSTGEALGWQAAYVMEVLTERAGPPAVAGGCVYLTTNAGLVAALDAATGLPRWAYQYDSSVSGAVSDATVRRVAEQAFILFSARQPLPPQNPIVVTGGRVIALPADSDAVLALDARRGTLLWQSPRAGQSDLSAVDDGRILLSGPDLMVLGAADGSVLRKVRQDVLGRPAVTVGAVIASGRGEIVRLDLGAPSPPESLPVVEEGAMLGRLVSVGGKLVAVNAAGVNAYLGYDEVWEVLSSRLKGARDPLQRFECRLQRGRLAILSGRLDQAAEEFREAAAEAPRTKDKAALGRVRPWMYRLAVRRATAATDDAEIGRHLDQARRYADAPHDQAQVLLRLVGYHETFGRYAQAAEHAQALAETHPDVFVTAPGAVYPVRGLDLAQREIARLIARHGRGAYAAMDRRLEEALRQAAPKEDVEAMLAAWKRWPHAARGPEALLAAAEVLYGRALSSSPPDAALAARASRILGQVRAAHPAGPDEDPAARLKARAAQALIDARFRPDLAAAEAAELKSAEAGAAVRFGGFQGTVASVLVRLNDVPPPIAPPPCDPFARAASNLVPLYWAVEGRPAVLRDPHGRPITIAERVFIHAAGTLVCLDSQAGDYESARLWTAGLPAALGHARRLAHLTPDRRRLALLGPETLSAVDAADGRVLYEKFLRELGIGGWSAAAGCGDGLVLLGQRGELWGVDIAAGRMVWSRTVPGLSPASLRVGGDLLAGRDGRDGNWVVCHDARTGDQVLALDRPRGGRIKTAALTPEGLLVTLKTDGELLLCDPRRPAAPPLGRASLGDPPGPVLAVGRRYVVAAEGDPGPVKVFDLADLSAPVVLREAGTAGEIVAAFLGDGRVYLLRAASVHGGDAAGYGLLRGPRLAAWEWPSGRWLWDRELAPEESGSCAVAEPQVGADAVSILVTPEDGRRASRQLVVRASGEVTDCGAVGAEAGGGTFAERAPPGAGSPVLLNGRVLLETESGLVMLRGDL